MTRTSMVSATQLRRCTELDYLLLGDLREMLEEPLTTQTRKWMLSVLDVLLDNLPQEHRLKSVDGYLGEVLQEFPNWQGRVDRLESQHYELYDRLSDLRDDLEVDALESSVAQALRYGLHEWMEALVAHRLQETDLLQSAVNTDLGGG
ncbi:MAG: hypothetical protein ACK5Q5_24820 [Planctomycetaceae bacterium]